MYYVILSEPSNCMLMLLIHWIFFPTSHKTVCHYLFLFLCDNWYCCFVMSKVIVVMFLFYSFQKIHWLLTAVLRISNVIFSLIEYWDTDYGLKVASVLRPPPPPSLSLSKWLWVPDICATSPLNNVHYGGWISFHLFYLLSPPRHIF